MGNRLLGICFFILAFSRSYPGYSQHTLSLAEAQEDMEYLIEEFRSHHLGLYLHESQEETDRLIDSLYTSLEPGMTDIQLFHQVKALIALTHEGHTRAYLPKPVQKFFQKSPEFLPLQIKFMDGLAIIHQYYGEEDLSLKRGTALLSVNGIPIEQIVEDLSPYIVTDGFSETGLYQDISDFFPYYYRLFWGPHRTFSIEVQAFGSEDIQRLSLKGITASEGNWKRARLDTPVFEPQVLGFELIQDSIAYLAVNSFSISPKKFRPWLQARFQALAQSSIKHLILDIQDNGGGEEGNENLLMAYLQRESFQKYAFVSMAPKPYLKRAKYKWMRADKWEAGEERAYRGEFTLQSDYFSETGHNQPDSSWVYTGKLYVLIGGVTFSGGAEFASMIKMTQRGVLVGEETGGAYEGNVSGYSHNIKLPHSRIEVSIPIVHFRMRVEPEIPSRGVMPDYKVPQGWADYLNGRNSKKEFVLKNMILEQ